MESQMTVYFDIIYNMKKDFGKDLERLRIVIFELRMTRRGRLAGLAESALQP